uniref:Uncharacterized protein n=1 Tax=Meleagris gallopavo TaxID=9103 RepID=G5E7J0_MELGA
MFLSSKFQLHKGVPKVSQMKQRHEENLILFFLDLVMVEVLKQLQGSIEDETMASSGQIDLLERLKELNLESTSFPGVKLRPKVSVRSYGSREGSVSSRSGECSPVPMGSFPRRGFMNGSRESTGYLEELEKERYIFLSHLKKTELSWHLIPICISSPLLFLSVFCKLLRQPWLVDQLFKPLNKKNSTGIMQSCSALSITFEGN